MGIRELGTKTEHLSMAARGAYASNSILMIGDGPGDLKAARGNDALFFPVNPGYEETSWEQFVDVAIDRFFGGSYAGDYEKRLIAQFETYLPKQPAWND